MSRTHLQDKHKNCFIGLGVVPWSEIGLTRVRIPHDSMIAIVTCDLSVHEGFLDYQSKPDSGHTQHHESVRVFGLQGSLSVEGIPQNARSQSHEIIN